MKNVEEKAVKILATLHALNKKYGKQYCYPSQLTMMNLLAVYQNTYIAIATFNRRCRATEDTGYLIRVRRIVKDKKRGTIFKSTLYKITLKGYQALKKLGVDVWKDMQAAKVAGFKAAERALAKRRGPVHIKTILAAPMIFGVRHKTYILDE